MLNFIRALPMTAQELLEEYFESEIVKAAIASVAIHGSTLGPMSAGTGYTLDPQLDESRWVVTCQCGQGRRDHICFGECREILWR